MRHLNNGTDQRHSKSCCDQSSPARRTITLASSVRYISVWGRHIDISKWSQYPMCIQHSPKHFNLARAFLKDVHSHPALIIRKVRVRYHFYSNGNISVSFETFSIKTESSLVHVSVIIPFYSTHNMMFENYSCWKGCNIAILWYISVTKELLKNETVKDNRMFSSACKIHIIIVNTIMKQPGSS